MKKKYIIVFFILIIIFSIIAYKKMNLGNNINSSDENNIILNISSYEAIVEIQVYSNKNTNKYKLKQQYIKPNIFKQEIIEPENMEGLTTIFDGTNLIIENNNLQLKTLYENYNCIQDNSLSLISFIEQYKADKNPQIEENNEEKIIRIKTNGNNYKAYKKLYINKKSKLPTKMEILDVNQNLMVYILYTEIKVNKTSKENVLVK